MEIVNKTLYNKDLIVRYNRFYLINFLRTNFVVVAVITIGFMAYMLAIGMWEYALVFLGILFFYFGLTLLMQWLTTKRVLRNSPLVEKPILQTYVFTDAGIIIENIRRGTLAYTEISKIRSNKDFYIIADFGRRTYIVEKSGFAEPASAIAELDRFFKEKYGKNFR